VQYNSFSNRIMMYLNSDKAKLHLSSLETQRE